MMSPISTSADCFDKQLTQEGWNLNFHVCQLISTKRSQNYRRNKFSIIGAKLVVKWRNITSIIDQRLIYRCFEQLQ